MSAVRRGEKWKTKFITSGGDGPVYDAKELLRRMAECAWHCGDPGVQYDTTINRWHTCPNSGRINASNPCVTCDTLVATENGLQRIDSLVGETPRVVDFNGVLRETTRVLETGVKQVYRLLTSSGYEVKLTEDHRVWSETHQRDVQAKDLRPGDRLRLVPVQFGPERLRRDAAELLGRSLGSAGEEQSDNRIVERIAAAYFDGAAVFEQSVIVDDADSEFLLRLDRESFTHLMRGILDSQGINARSGGNAERLDRVEITSPSRDLLRQLQLLLLGLGVKSRTLLDDELGDVYEDLAHQLSISGRDWRRLVARLQDASSTPPRAELMFDAVESLEPLSVEPVYDLTEPVTSHFVANGIAVHNCSEYMFLDDTACNLASINLMKFRREDGSFDVDGFASACRIYFIAQEILVDHASYPTDRIAENSHRYRPLGLGYSNLGSLIMASGVPYDSPEAYGLCGSITAILHGSANLTSTELAAAVGPFEGYAANRDPFLKVMRMHREEVEHIDDAGPRELKEAARDLWDKVVEQGKKYGFRNAQATVLAPTGTISFMMDCDTTGIEPDIALVKYKQLAGGGMLKIVNRMVPMALATLGYDASQIKTIIQWIDENDTIEGAPGLKEEHLAVFDCAFKPAGGVRSIGWRAHVRMMAAAQPFISGAISKTVNMPTETTPDDIADAYFWGWELGLKALAIYRDGSKQSQPLSTESEASKKAKKDAGAARPRRERLPDTRESITHKFNVAGHEGYITVGLYEDRRPGELFITMAKEGSTIGGLMDCFGTAISINLQYGVPLEVLVNKFSHTRFEPMGHTTNPDIRIAKSLVDYIFRWLGITFMPGFREASRGELHVNGKSGESRVESGEPEGKAESGKPKAEPSSITDRLAPGLAPRSPEPGAKNSGAPKSEHPVNGGNGAPAIDVSLLERAGVAFLAESATTERSQQFATFQSDAPSCDNCGAITVRNGNCYLCHNCGNSMGCS
jgi:ribonucleoside-diphosphate reductase alpha chain